VLTPPQPITADHDLSRFACSRPELDAWLRDRAAISHAYGHAKTQVVVDDETGAVVAFYSLAPGSVVHARLVRKLRTNAPNPVPMILLARLAVDAAYAGRGIGRHLLLDAFRRSDLAAREIGGRGIMTHPKDEQAASFYLRWKFQRMPGDPLLLVIPMEVIRASLAAAAQVASGVT
jgi:GNAT superfamily N-acetyltransferase